MSKATPACSTARLAGELDHLAIGPVRGIDLGLVAAPVRGRADEADLGPVEMRREARQPAGRNDRVVVEDDEDVAVGHARGPG